MQNLNLYDYYDKSLADINREYLEAARAKKKKPEKKKSNGKYFILTAFLLVAAAVPLAVYFGFDRGAPVTLKVEEENAKPDLRSTEEKLGYVKVQIFEFAEEAPEAPAPSSGEIRITDLAKAEPLPETLRPTAYDKKKQILDSLEDTAPKKAPEISKSEAAEKAPKETAGTKTKPASPGKKAVAPADKRYSILFENIDEEEYRAVQKIGLKFKMTPNIVDSSSKEGTVWRVYKTDPKGGMEIGGKKLEFAAEFPTKEEALAYAKENVSRAVIRSEDVTARSYSMRFCCGSLDEAKTFAQSSDIMNKVIKIVREK